MARLRFALLLAVAAGPAPADPANVVDAEFRVFSDGVAAYVTIEHGDTGWDDYADGWRVETMDGTVLGTRDLGHPHVEEMPFTRALKAIDVPEGVTEVYLRTRTNVTGWADRVWGPYRLPDEGS